MSGGKSEIFHEAVLKINQKNTKPRRIDRQYQIPVKVDFSHQNNQYYCSLDLDLFLDIWVLEVKDKVGNKEVILCQSR